jgi:amino-acid N-acetyltransferase
MPTIERAAAADLPAVEALLRQAGLPLDGAADAFASGVVARDDGRIVGCAAVELFGAAALVRSIAVDPQARGQGLGSALLAAVETRARESGAHEAYLLTETAEDWFPRFGYRPVARADVAAPVAGSIEFTTACTASCAAFRRDLD